MRPYILLILIACTLGSIAQNDNFQNSPIVLIYDASGSMWGQIDGTSKNEIASSVVTATVSNLPSQQGVGLVAYGHRSKGDCKDVEFIIPKENTDRQKIADALKGIKPLGKTPLAYSASLVIDKLKADKAKATIILLTDGIESCDGDLCKVIQEAKKAGINFKLHIIGFGLKDEETQNLKCAAKAGDGEYYDAENAAGLGEVLHRATSSTVDDPDPNFTVYATKNGKAIDAYIRAFSKSPNVKDIAARTYKDTASFYLDPGEWEIEVKPLEQSDVKASIIKVTARDPKNSHRTVSFDAGKLKITTTNNGEGWDAVVNIYQAGTKTRAANGRTYGKEDIYDLNPGNYDIQLSALKIEGEGVKITIPNIEVKANLEEEVKHNFTSGTALIGASAKSGLVDAVVKIQDVKTKANVSSGRTYTTESNNPDTYLLSPGSYQVTLTALGEYKGKTETFVIEVKKGETVEKIISF